MSQEESEPLIVFEPKSAVTVPEPTLKERLIGVEGSTRRTISYYVTAVILSTLVRDFMFRPNIFGRYLLKTLAPVERDSVKWGYIFLTRLIDITLGVWAWKRVDGVTRRDGALFGALFALVSRIPLYGFEHAYFLLSTETVSTLALIDFASLTAAFSLLPTFLPHSVAPRPSPTVAQRLNRNPELMANIIFAVGLATCAGGIFSFIAERLGGQEFIKSQVSDRVVPSYLSAGTLSPSQIMAMPTIHIPTLRPLLTPRLMSTHIIQSALATLPTVPLTAILPSLSPAVLAAFFFTLVAPASTLLLWDVLPITFKAAAAVGTGLGLKMALAALVTAWTIEELRAKFWTERVAVLVVEDGEVEAVIEAEVEVEPVLVEESVPAESDVLIQDAPSPAEKSLKKRRSKKSLKADHE